MSREVLDEYIEKLDEGEADIGTIIEDIVEYGFADENDLCRVLEIDSANLDDLVSSSDTFDDKQLTKYSTLLIKYLKKVRKTYGKYYFRASP